MIAPMRRGACPTLTTPMQTGDGLLARINPLAGGLSGKALIGLCESALRHGNGIIEVTARGSLQVRGLTPSSAQELAQEIDALGIAVRTGVPVATGPLAGIDPAEISDPRPLAQAIRSAIDDAGLAPRLGPKVSVIVDGGGRFGMDAIIADVRLKAIRQNGQALWHCAIAGDAATARPLGLTSEIEACSTTIAILETLASIGRDTRAKDIKTRPLSGLPAISPTRGETNLSSLLSPISTAAGKVRRPKQQVSPLVGEMAGRPERGKLQLSISAPSNQIAILPLSGSLYALGIALSFGSMPAGNLTKLAIEAEALGATEIRPAPQRTLLFLGPSHHACQTLQKIATALGFVTDPGDPRLSIAACPGAPACTSAGIATREIAEQFARENSDIFDGSFTLHVSGCRKGCAHPTSTALTLVGADDGVALVVDGTAGTMPAGRRSADTVTEGLAGLAARLRASRQENETSAACLSRLGAADIATAFGNEHA